MWSHSDNGAAASAWKSTVLGCGDNTLKGVARADVDARMGDCDVRIRWKFKMPRLEVLASSGDQRRLRPARRRGNRTEFGREGLTVFIAQVQSEQSIEQRSMHVPSELPPPKPAPMGMTLCR